MENSSSSPAPQLAIVVSSCDRYADLWKPFFEIFRRQWPDCPYPIFLGTNARTHPDNRVTSVCAGPDRGWARNLLRVLDSVPAGHVLLLLEDFLLTQPVDTAAVRALERLAVENRLACLRLTPKPAPSRRLPNFPDLGEIRKGDDYRVSTQAAIWETASLRRLLRPEFSAWEFEQIGSLLSERLVEGAFWGSYRPVLDYRHGVERGRWLPKGLDICRQAHVEVDLATRSAQQGTARWSAWRKAVLFHVFRIGLPRKVHRWLRLLKYRRIVDRILAEEQSSLSQ